GHSPGAIHDSVAIGIHVFAGAIAVHVVGARVGVIDDAIAIAVFLARDNIAKLVPGVGPGLQQAVRVHELRALLDQVAVFIVVVGVQGGVGSLVGETHQLVVLVVLVCVLYQRSADPSNEDR